MSDIILFSIPTEKVEELIEKAVSQAISKYSPDTNNDIRELLTRKEAAQYLNVSIATLDNWARQGKINKHHNGAAIRFKKNELDQSFKCLNKYQRG